MATVLADSVRKSYGKIETVHGVSITVPDGAFVVLVGPSGCGKSTLLRMIAGLEEITSGTISIDGEVINDVEPKHRDIAMVFQNYALYPHMTVAENMGFSLRLARKPKDEIDRRVVDAAGILGLQDLLGRYPKQLSGGQRQRVAMGRAIVRSPQVFLFDEPLSNLDAKLRVQMRGELKDLHRRLKTTTIYVTHDQLEAMTMADQIVVMRDGLVEQVGAPLEIYDRPRNIFVASFIGSPAMNLIDGRIIRNADGYCFAGAGGQHLPVDQSVASTRLDRDVVYGLRPEHLFVTSDGGGIEATVSVLEPTGSETHIVADIGGDPITALLRERIDAPPGTVLPLGIKEGTSHIFDPATGSRLE